MTKKRTSPATFSIYPHTKLSLNGQLKHQNHPKFSNSHGLITSFRVSKACILNQQHG